MSTSLSGGNWVHTGATDAVDVIVSRDVTLFGYRLWGVRTGSGSHDVTIRVKDNQGRTLGMKKGTYRTVSSQGTFVVKFTRPVDLRKDVRYTLSALLLGPPARRGISGQKTITCNGVTIRIFTSSENKNGSSQRFGQIPALLMGEDGRKCK